jgi:DnaJ-domain-containing protein 1
MPLYVYAIVPARADGAAAFGVDCAAGRLDTIAAGSFAAVVGDGPHTGGLGRSREALVPQLLAHQRTIEQIMQTVPLLPVKFGTFVPDAASVCAILERGSPAFRAAFDRLKNCVQVEIRVEWDVQAVFAEIANEEAITELRQECKLNSDASEEGLCIALGRHVKQSLESRRSALAAALSESLRAVAVDAIAYPATADQIVLHLMLLMRTGEMAALDRCLEALDAAHDGRLTYRCIGPLAPYSFATVEIEVVEVAALSQAMRLLDVGPATNAAEIQMAYRRAAKHAHPDMAGAGVNGNTSMAALTDACRLLSLHAEAGGRQRDKGADLPFGRPCLTGRSVLVSVRRQERTVDASA